MNIVEIYRIDKMQSRNTMVQRKEDKVTVWEMLTSRGAQFSCQSGQVPSLIKYYKSLADAIRFVLTQRKPQKNKMRK